MLHFSQPRHLRQHLAEPLRSLLFFLLCLPVHAMAQSTAAEESITATINAVERQEGPFAPALYEPVMQLAKARLSNQDYAGAGDLLQRAQHITHRKDGVRTVSQVEAVQLLSDIAIATGDYGAANLQQKFIFFLKQRQTNEGQPPSLEAWFDFTHWLLNTGQPVRARRLLKEAFDLATHPDQQLYAGLLDDQARKLQGLCCSNLLADAIDQARGADGVSASRLAAAYLAQADSLLLERREDEAAGWYLKAAALNPADANTEARIIPARGVITSLRQDRITGYRLSQPHFGDPDRLEMMTRTEQLEHEHQSPQWFIVNGGEQMGFRLKDGHQATRLTREVQMLVGAPLMFDEEQLKFMLPGYLQLPAARSGLAVTLGFDITPAGRAVNIGVVDSNAPAKVNRLLTKALGRVVWRPKLVNGIPVAKTNVRIVQTFDAPKHPLSLSASSQKKGGR